MRASAGRDTVAEPPTTCSPVGNVLDAGAAKAGAASVLHTAAARRACFMRKIRKKPRGQTSAPGVLLAPPSGVEALKRCYCLRVCDALGLDVDGGGLVVEDGEVAGDLGAFFHLDLGVADLARHLAAGVDDQLLAHRDLAFEAAANLGLVDGDGALEHAMLGDLEHARIERGFDTAFDDQRVAIADLDAFDLDVVADDQLRLLAVSCLRLDDGFGGRGRRSGGNRRGGRLRLPERLVAPVTEEPVFL